MWKAGGEKKTTSELSLHQPERAPPGNHLSEAANDLQKNQLPAITVQRLQVLTLETREVTSGAEGEGTGEKGWVVVVGAVDGGIGKPRLGSRKVGGGGREGGIGHCITVCKIRRLIVPGIIFVLAECYFYDIELSAITRAPARP